MEILSILNINVIGHMWKVGNGFFKKRIICFLKSERNIGAEEYLELDSKVRKVVSLYNLLRVNF